MTKNIFKALTVTAIGLSVLACNSETELENPTLSSSALISAFSLGTNDDILANLDSVFFSIDPVAGKIYNADSLPYGTRINRLVPIISTESASSVELSVPRENMSDTVFSYLDHTADSVDFSQGPVKVKVVSADGNCTRTYQISVNVHKQKPDSLVWDRVGVSNLPSLFQVPTSQRTVTDGSKYYCLTEENGNYCMATATTPAGTWTRQAVTFNFTPVVSSLAATDDALYLLDTNGTLYRSADGTAWQSVARGWSNIYGGYGKVLWGSQKDGNTWYRVSYPDGARQQIEANFPVSGTSVPVCYTFEMSDNAQMLMLGGRLADGSLSGDTWGYDGKTWACLSLKSLPEGIVSPVVVPYYVVKVNTNNWIATRSSVLMAMFGMLEDGTYNTKVYVSPDFGCNWKLAPALMQINERIPGRAEAQGFLTEETLTAGSAKAPYRDLFGATLPVGARWDEPRATDITTLAVKPITEWECPYIYVFGGVGAEAQTYNTVWRGVIRRFTYLPLY